MTGDKNYYRRRIQQELAAALATQSDSARRAHVELAQLYVAKLHLIELLSLDDAAPVRGARAAKASRRIRLSYSSQD